MFNHKHYVPILKTKAGERWAVDRLTAAAAGHLTPLFEIHTHKTKADGAHAIEMCESLASIWGAPFFLDTVWLHGASGDSAIIEATFDAARSANLQAIPVVRTSYDQATLDVIIDIMAQDSRGCMIRVPSVGLQVASIVIPTTLQYLQVPFGQVDFLLDYRHHPMDLATDVPQIPNLAAWRSFSAASGAFPRSLMGLPLNTWHAVSRHDWNCWLDGVLNGGLARKPAFSDYTLRDPGPAPSGGDPSVTLKYTLSNQWQVRVGRKFKDGFSTDIRPICTSLVTGGTFSGAGFSAGDAIINLQAQTPPPPGPGGPQNWLQWAMNHHMTFVVDQIQKHAGL